MESGKTDGKVSAVWLGLAVVVVLVVLVVLVRDPFPNRTGDVS